MNKKPTAEEFWQARNGGKHSKDATKDGELITPTYAVLLMEAHANNAVEEYKRDMVEILKSSLYEYPQNEMQEGAQIIMNSLIAKLNMKNMTVYTKEELRKLLTNKD